MNFSVRKNVLIFSFLFELNVAYSAYFVGFFESRPLEHHLGLVLYFAGVKTLTAKILVNVKILICTSESLTVTSTAPLANLQTTFFAFAPMVTSAVAKKFPATVSEAMI